jgi:hypothetical protein
MSAANRNHRLTIVKIGSPSASPALLFTARPGERGTAFLVFIGFDVVIRAVTSTFSNGGSVHQPDGTGWMIGNEKLPILCLQSFMPTGKLWERIIKRNVVFRANAT